MSRRRLRFWLLFLSGWWLGLIFGRVSNEMDVGWWDTLFLFLVGGFTFWLVLAARRAEDRAVEREESVR